MGEYIIDIPDECFPVGDHERTMYYPDERDDPMPITPISRTESGVINTRPLHADCSTCTERQGYYLDAETIRNQQERIAELERERDYNAELNREATALNNRYARKLEDRDELIRDCLKLLGTWDRAEWDNTSDIYTAGMEYEPEGNYAALIERARKMGVEL